MTGNKQVRILIQAMGLYLLANSLLAVMTATSRFIAWFIQSGMVVPATSKQFIMEDFMLAALVLIPAWVLLTKTDWCTRAVEDLSTPRAKEELEE